MIDSEHLFACGVQLVDVAKVVNSKLRTHVKNGSQMYLLFFVHLPKNVIIQFVKLPLMTEWLEIRVFLQPLAFGIGVM